MQGCEGAASKPGKRITEPIFDDADGGDRLVHPFPRLAHLHSRPLPACIHDNPTDGTRTFSLFNAKLEIIYFLSTKSLCLYMTSNGGGLIFVFF